MKILIFISIFVIIVKADFYIDDYSGAQKVPKDSTFSLYCHVTDGGSISDNDDWKVCKWIREKDGSSCLFKYICKGSLCGIGSGDFHIETTCSDVFYNKVQYWGDEPNVSNHLCGMNVTRADVNQDSGTWKCIIEQCKSVGCGTAFGSGVTVSKTMTLTVTP